MARPRKDFKKVTKPKRQTDKKTVVRKITDLQYYTLLWILEHKDEYRRGEIIDTSIFDKSTVDKKLKRRCFYVTDEENGLIRDYLGGSARRTTSDDFLKAVGWQKDPKFITKPIGSVIRYKQDNQIGNSQITPVTPVMPIMPIDTTLESEADYQPSTQYSVFDDKERMQLAIKLQKKAVDGEMLNSVGLPYFDTVDMSQYLFIKDLNKQVQDVSEIDYHVLFYMIETRKISPIEAKLVLIKVGAGGVPDKRPHDLLKYGVPRFYDEDSTMLSAMIKAETFAYKYDKMLADGDPDPDYIFERFKDHISNEIFPSVKYPQMLDFQYNKNIDVKDISINNDTVTVTYDDIIEGDEGVTADVKYTDHDLLLNDFVCYERTFKINPNRQHNVWGEIMSINDYIKKLYVQYPHGINGDFYATMKEAYEAGAACINEIA